MFRQTKRKLKPRTRNSTIDESNESNVHTTSTDTTKPPQPLLVQNENDEEEPDTVIIRRRTDRKKKSSKLKRINSGGGDGGDDGDGGGADGTFRSFAPEEEEFTVALKKSSKKRRRKGGLGFGGMAMPNEEEEQPDSSKKAASTETATIEVVSSSSAYGKDALDQLKAEQRRRAKPKTQTPVQESIENMAFRPPPSRTTQQPLSLPLPQSNEQNFIALADDGNPTFSTVMAPEDDMDTEKPDPTTTVLDDDDILMQGEEEDWEDQIARRAGVPLSASYSGAYTSAPTNAPTLEVLRDNLQSTLVDLTAREEDLGNAIMRREADLAQTQADVTRQQKSAKEAGNACSEYQQLRYDLAMWVGALRDLQGKVTPIQTTVTDLLTSHFATAHQEWMDWQDDVCGTLREGEQLDRILGRQPPDTISEDAAMQQLDEFGRDIGSQIRRDRDNRLQKRRRRQEEARLQHQERGDDQDIILDCLWIPAEGEEKRYDLLQEALRVAMDDLDDTYASVEKLGSAFQPWKQNYSEEYAQCYANLSLADLSYVFDQVLFCRSDCIRSLVKRTDSQTLKGSFFPTALKMPEDGSSIGSGPSNAAAERSFRKHFIPLMLKLLKESPILLFLSPRIARLFGESSEAMVKMLGAESDSTTQLCKSIATSAIQILEEVSIPLLVASDATKETDMNDLMRGAIHFADTKQVHWIHCMVLNLLMHWLPILQKKDAYHAVGKAILGFLSGNFLYLLSSLPAKVATESLAPIWKTLCENHEGLLESPDFILQSAPLRAASQAYGLPSLAEIR